MKEKYLKIQRLYPTYCTNKIGNHECTCKTGYVGDGQTCDDIDECTVNNQCSEVATCTNTPGCFECACMDGYEGKF